jgi:hypothetical protein
VIVALPVKFIRVVQRLYVDRVINAEEAVKLVRVLAVTLVKMGNAIFRVLLAIRGTHKMVLPVLTGATAQVVSKQEAVQPGHTRLM